jgi:hypothetical protein
MILNKIVVDRLAPAKSLFETVPETNLIFAEFPTQAHGLALISREKIDQSSIDVFDQRARLLYAIGSVLQRRGTGISSSPQSKMRTRIDPRSTGHANALGVIFDSIVSVLIFRAMKQNVAQREFNLGQSPFGFGECEKSRHVLCRRAHSSHESQGGDA